MATTTEPAIVVKPAQPFAAMALTLTQPEISRLAPPLIADVIDWLNRKGVRATGAPFFNYVAHLPGGRMEMHVGMPTASVLPADATVVTGAVPGGRFASVTHTGPYSGLHDANMKLDAWVGEKRLRLDGTRQGDRMTGTTRLEIYLDPGDPGPGPSGDPVTEIAYRLAD